MLVKLKILRGFTLVELAMVLFIVGLLLGGLLVPMSLKIEQQNRSTTNEALNEARAAMLGYTVINGRLPCPDCPDAGTSAGCTSISNDNPDAINDGIEDGVDLSGNPAVRGNYASCATTWGNLPWTTLGVSEVDAWSNSFFYRVTNELADDINGATPCDNITINVSFCISSEGDIAIESAAGNPVANDVPAVIISFGSNGPDDPRSDAEDENLDHGANSIYISNDYISASGAEFDDMTIWLSPNILMNRMITSGRLP